MKSWMMSVLILGMPVWASAQTGVKRCDDLKAEIAKKLDAKGVVNYTLTIIDKGKETDGKIVGSCQGGTKSIVYSRAARTKEPGPSPAARPKPPAAKKAK